MDFIQEDWEYEFQRDGIYILEARKQMELEWQEYENSLLRKPAKINLITPLKTRKNAVRNKLTSLRRNYKKRVHS
jgi:hypothetical protein